MKKIFTAIITAGVALGLPTLAYAEPETVETNKKYVVIHEADGINRICYDFNDISRIEHELTYDELDAATAGLRFSEITDKSGWSISYGSLAMPFGPFAKMIDGQENGDGWMGYINDGFKGSPGLGHPFVVVDLGQEVRLGALGILAGELSSHTHWDVHPAKVDFYITDRTDVAINLSERERNLMNGSDGNNLADYFPLHNKLKASDNQFGWKKVGSVVISGANPSAVGRYYYYLNNSQLADNLTTRFVKLDVTPFGPSDTPGDRTKIFELYVRSVAE